MRYAKTLMAAALLALGLTPALAQAQDAEPQKDKTETKTETATTTPTPEQDKTQAQVTVDVLPINLNQMEFAGGKTHLVITNKTDHPVKVEGAFPKEAPMLIFAPRTVSVEVPAGQEKEVPVNIQPVNQATSVAVPPVVKFDWKATSPDKPEFSVENEAVFALNQNFLIPQAPEGVTVDGNLDDWDELPYEYQVPEDLAELKDYWQGPDDTSFRFATAVDEEAVYLAVEVIDDNVFVPAKPDIARDQDGIQVQIDARAERLRNLASSAGEQERDSYTNILLQPGRRIDPIDEQPGLKVVSQQTDRGYTLEARIPRVVLLEQGQEKLSAFRLNIAVDDADAEDEPAHTIWWNADWQASENRPGSGTFVIAESPGR